MEFEFIEYNPNTKYAKKNAMLSKTPQAFTDCGIKFDGSFCVIDFDNVDKSLVENICSFFKINTMIVYTDRGFHMYFKKPTKALPSRYICKLGLEVEFKHKGSITYKRNGIVRDTINYGVLANLPDCLRQVKRVEPLLNLEEGEGRNQKLFKYNGKITLEQARFINKFIFATPLPDQELETILRKQDNQISEKELEAPDIFIAKQFCDKFLMKTHNGTIYFKTDEKTNLYKVFTSTRENMNCEQLFFTHEIDNITDQFKLDRTKSYKQYQNILSCVIEEAKTRVVKDCDMIALRNGFIVKQDNGTLDFVEILDDTFCSTQFDITYKPNTECQDVDNFIEWTEHKNVIYQFLANLLEPSFEARRKGNQILVLYGSGKNGKSVLLDMIKNMLNNSNLYSTATIQFLDDERNIGELGGKCAWFGEELGSNAWSGARFNRIKKIVTGEQMNYSPKYAGTRVIRVAPSIIFTTNHLDFSGEKTSAFERRVVFVHMKKQPTQIDLNLTQKLTTNEAVSHLLDIAINYYNETVVDGYRDRTYVLNKDEKDFMENYSQDNNPIKYFFKEHEKSLVGLSITEIRDKFLESLDEELGVETARTGKELKGFQKKIKQYILSNYDCDLSTNRFIINSYETVFDLEAIKKRLDETTFYNRMSAQTLLMKEFGISGEVADDLLEGAEVCQVTSNGRRKIAYSL